MPLFMEVPLFKGSDIYIPPLTGKPEQQQFTVFFTVTVTINGLVKPLAFNVHIFPSKYPVFLKQ